MPTIRPFVAKLALVAGAVLIVLGYGLVHWMTGLGVGLLILGAAGWWASRPPSA